MAIESGKEMSKFKKYRRAFFGEFTEAILAAVLVAIVLRVFFVSVYRVPTDSMAPTLIPGDFILGWKTSYGLKLPMAELVWGERLPERGDIVAFRIPGERSLYVKRVIGLPGDRVAVENGRVSVNENVITSEPLPLQSVPAGLEKVLASIAQPETLDVQIEAKAQVSEEQIGPSTHAVIRRRDAPEPDFLAPTIVPPGEVFLMGDFRSESVDSRQWGAIPISAIESRIAWVVLSLRVRKIEHEAATTPTEEAAVRPSPRIRWNRLFHKIR